jgi:uncharacterized membrane protein YtjA (UPF0391 family)
MGCNLLRSRNIAALFGLRGIAGITMAVSRWLVIIFIILAVVSLVL